MFFRSKFMLSSRMITINDKRCYWYFLLYLVLVSLTQGLCGFTSTRNFQSLKLPVFPYQKETNRRHYIGYSLLLMMNSIPINNDNSSINNEGVMNIVDPTNVEQFSHQRTESILETSSATLNVTAAVQFATLVGRLKSTPRTGWVRRNVPQYESVADHSWRVAILSFLLLGNDKESIDIGKVIQLALVHDLAECLIGDLTPEDNISKIDKQRMEHDAMVRITNLLHNATVNDTIQSTNDASSNVLMQLFNEYEERVTIESIIVKDLDLLDMILQADEYEQRYPTIDLSDFFVGTPISKFQLQYIRQIASYVHEQRNNRRIKDIQDKKDIKDYRQNVIGDHSNDEKQIQQEQHSSIPLNNYPDLRKDEDGTLIPSNDADFVTEYSKTISSTNSMSTNDILSIVQALRQWDIDRTIR